MPRPKPRRSSSTRAGVGDAFDDLADLVRAQPVVGHDRAQRALVGALPLGQRALEEREVVLRGRNGFGLVVDARCRRRRWRTWTSIGPTSSGENTPSPPPSIIAGPPMPMFESSVAMTTSHAPSRAALPAKQYPELMATVGTTPLSRAIDENVGVTSGRDSMPGARLAALLAGAVAAGAGAAAAALGEEHERQAPRLGQLEHAVGLRVVDRTLRAGEDRVVVRAHDGARAGRVRTARR